MTRSEINRQYPFMKEGNAKPEHLDLSPKLYHTLCHVANIEIDFQNELEILNFLKGKDLDDIRYFELDGHDIMELREWIINHVTAD